MKEVKNLKFLGDIISTTPEESIHKTVLKRQAIVKQTIIEIRTIIEDTRASNIGGINLAFDLWETVISSLLYNAETWLNIPKKTIKLLKNIFSCFYSCIFRIGRGTPIVNYYWQVGSLTVENIILQKKLMYWFHIKNLPDESLVKEVLEKQEEKGLFCLTTEIREDLEEMKVTNPHSLSKWQYKRKVKEYVREKQGKNIKSKNQRNTRK